MSAPWDLCLTHTHTHTHTQHTHTTLYYTGDHESRVSVAKQEIDAKWHKRMQKEKEGVSEKLLNSLDKEGRAELVDNGWLKREVYTHN